MVIGVVMVMAVGLCVAMGLAMAGGIGATLRQEGLSPPLQHQPPTLQQVGQHRILQEAQLPLPHLQRHMAIAEVISGPQQLQSIRRPHQQQGLRRGLHQHPGPALLIAQQFSRGQGLTPGQLQQEGPAAEALTQAPQPGAVVGPEGQTQGIPGCGSGGKATGEQQGLAHGDSHERGQGRGHGVCIPAAGRPEWASRPHRTPMSRAAADTPTPTTGWHGTARMQFTAGAAGTVLQGGATAPLKLQRTFSRADGRCELPLLHTAGGLVGGDRLSLDIRLGTASRALITSVAAQKVYGSIGRSRRAPAGTWATQELNVQLAAGADLEWLPQELVLYADGLYEQTVRVDLEPGASWLGAEVVRLGRTAAGEDLGRGRWRSALELRRLGAEGPRWELVDRLELGGDALPEEHGMAGAAVFGSLTWAAPDPLEAARLEALLADLRADRGTLEGEMACGALQQGVVARYRGPSTTAARSWFTRIWARLRRERGLAAPERPRVWPFQEDPLG